jgi:hypothetical protein
MELKAQIRNQVSKEHCGQIEFGGTNEACKSLYDAMREVGLELYVPTAEIGANGRPEPSRSPEQQTEDQQESPGPKLDEVLEKFSGLPKMPGPIRSVYNSLPDEEKKALEPLKRDGSVVKGIRYKLAGK